MSAKSARHNQDDISESLFEPDDGSLEISESRAMEQKKKRAEAERKATRKRKLIVIGAAVGVFLFGMLLGSTLFPRTVTEKTTVGQVSSVESKLPAYTQLESERESRISLLENQLGNLRQQTASNDATASVIVGLHDQLTGRYDQAIGAIVAANVTCDDIAHTIAADGQVSAEKQQAAQGLLSQLTSANIVSAGDNGAVACVFAGGSPKADLGDCGKVSMAQVKLVSVIADETGATKGYVFELAVPIATTDGSLASASYVIACDINGTMRYCAYAGSTNDGIASAIMADTAAASASF